MKRLNNINMESTLGGSAIGDFCTGASAARAGIAAWNYAVAVGLIEAGTVATGGGLVLALAGACAIYSTGRAFSWW